VGCTVNFSDVSGAAEVVASVHPVNPSSKPGLVIRLSDVTTYVLLLMVTVSPDCQAWLNKALVTNRQVRVIRFNVLWIVEGRVLAGLFMMMVVN